MVRVPSNCFLVSNGRQNIPLDMDQLQDDLQECLKKSGCSSPWVANDFTTAIADYFSTNESAKHISIKQIAIQIAQLLENNNYADAANLFKEKFGLRSVDSQLNPLSKVLQNMSVDSDIAYHNLYETVNKKIHALNFSDVSEELMKQIALHEIKETIPVKHTQQKDILKKSWEEGDRVLAKAVSGGHFFRSIRLSVNLNAVAQLKPLQPFYELGYIAYLANFLKTIIEESRFNLFDIEYFLIHLNEMQTTALRCPESTRNSFKTQIMNIVEDVFKKQISSKTKIQMSIH